MIYYSLWNPEDGEKYDRIYYSYTDEAFTTLTKPQLLFDWGYATIDADINYLESDGLYHMMVKKEGGVPGLFTSTAPTLHGPWPPALPPNPPQRIPPLSRPRKRAGNGVANTVRGGHHRVRSER